MSSVIIVDTSVLLNVLDVPAFNQERERVLARFFGFVDAGASFLLPLAAIFETGDHIADLSNGQHRRRYAGILRDRIHEALKGEAPWVLTPFPDERQLARWLDDFPESAMQGPDLSDLSIIKAWETECARHKSRRVRIWSLDRHLQGYDQVP